MLEIADTERGHIVSFKYNKSLVDGIKMIPGSKYLGPTLKQWFVPKESSRALLNWAQTFGVAKVIAEPKEEIGEIEPLPELGVEVPLKLSMYEFQKKAVAYNIQRGSSLNGDQQGLGKTIETIASVVAMNLFPCLVISRKSLLPGWETEWQLWTDKKVIYLKPNKKTTWSTYLKCGMADVCLVNYDSLHSHFIQSIDIPKGETFRIKHIQFKEDIRLFKSVVIDESHYVKDGATKRTKYCIGLTRHLKDKGVFLLSGTPVLNDPSEIYPQLMMLNRAHLFGNFEQFKKTYKGSKNKYNLKRLSYLLHKHVYFRRLKTEVKADLPPKTRQIILCDINNREEYNRAENHFKEYLKQTMHLTNGQIDKKLRAEAMVQMAILKKIAAKGKMEVVKEWMEDLIQQEEKIVMFGHHREITEKMSEFFPDKTIRLCGTAKNPEDLKERKRKFQQDRTTMIAVCSLMADSEGHTLNAASNLGMVELPWHFGKAEQIEDRIHRINNWMPANISYFIAEKTIDRKIYKVIMSKKDMHDAITGTDEEIEEKTIDMLINLFNQEE